MIPIYFAAVCLRHSTGSRIRSTVEMQDAPFLGREGTTTPVAPILGARRWIDLVLNAYHTTKRNSLWIGVPRCCDEVKIHDASTSAIRKLTLLKLCVAFTPRAWGSLNEYLTVIDRERKFSTVIRGLVGNILLDPF